MQPRIGKFAIVVAIAFIVFCVWASASHASRFFATTYGPPWNAMEGGGWTATGMKLGEGTKKDPYRHRHIIAVDPSVIPFHTLVTIWPNPLNYRGAFQAEDVGGAIKGRHIDIYSWRQDGSRDHWSRMVNVRFVRRSYHMKMSEIPIKRRHSTKWNSLK